jgi:hypothetical protein
MPNSDAQQPIPIRCVVAINARLMGGVPGLLDTRFKEVEVERE